MMPEAAPVVGSYVSRRLSRPVCAAFHADEVSTMRGTMARNCVRKCSSWSPAVRLATLALVMLLFTSLPLIESLESSSTRIKKRRHRQTGGDTSILCRATPIMQRENAFARYQTMQPSSNIEEFLEEWRADIPAKDRARFVPMRVVSFASFRGLLSTLTYNMCVMTLKYHRTRICSTEQIYMLLLPAWSRLPGFCCSCERCHDKEGCRHKAGDDAADEYMSSV